MSDVEIEKKVTKVWKKYDFCVTVKDIKGGMGVFYTSIKPVIEDDSLVIMIGEDESSENKIIYFNMPNVISYGISRVRKGTAVKEEKNGEDN